MGEITPLPNQGSATTKAALGAVGGGAVIGSVALLHPDRTIILILLGAILLIPLLLLVYKLILKMLAARKARPFADSVTNAAGSTPNSISAAASRAKLDDLRRNFEGGVVKFRAAGKDLYQVPWYVLIGESGSGKTEAIRHSGIPFPPGLQDQLQGAGGTVNMNWWFTNDAVILDTAGRYLFDEVQPGASSEWTEFLRLLARYRPQCPINGLLLVIPANSLILDTADQIEAKAGKIAQQLDRIQRTLDLRFPVFVVVTKCDLINGFREFFDGFTQQSQQHQILGWSNPAPLDEPFNAELVDQHLKTVHTRLMERRLGLLLDPVARESADAKRVDEVDSLFSLPDSFLRIGPRLQQYLGMVFVAGEWSPKPLFLRGIYFTSSMREGQALDSELAELLGVPIDSLNETRMWDKDRAFFLKDLFLKKVFPEKGLVTRAVSASKVERNRKVALLAGGFASAMALLGFTFFGAKQLDNSVSGQARKWSTFLGTPDAGNGVDFSIIKRTASTGAGKPQTRPSFESRLGEIPAGQSETVGALHKDLLDLQQKEIKVPLVLRPAAGIIDSSVHSADLNANQHLAYQKKFAESVIAPLTDAVSEKFRAETPGNWPDPDTATPALGELIHLRAHQPPNLTALFVHAVSPNGIAKDKDNLMTLEAGLKAAQPASGIWPEPVEVTDASLDAGVGRFIDHWNMSLATVDGEYRRLIVSGGEPGALQSAQENLATICATFSNRPPKTLDEYNQDVKAWNDAWARYENAYKPVHDRVEKLRDAGGMPSFAEQYRGAHKLAAGNAEAAYDTLLLSFPASPTADAQAPDSAAPDKLMTLRKQLQTARSSLGSTINSEIVDALTKYDKSLLVPVGSGTSDTPPQYLFEIVHHAYTTANTQLGAVPDPVKITGAPEGTAALTPADARRAIEEKAAAQKDVESQVARLPEKSDSDKATRTAVMKGCDALFDTLILPKAHYDDLNARLPENTMTVGELVSAKAIAARRSVLSRKFDVPLTSVKDIAIASRYDPAAASEVLTTQQLVLKDIAEECAKVVPAKQGYDVPYTLDGDNLNSRRTRRQTEMDSYIAAYADAYDRLRRQAAIPALNTGASWETLQSKTLPDNPSSTIVDSLKEVGQFVAGALKQLPGTAGENESVRKAGAAVDAGLAAIGADDGDKFIKIMSNWRDLGPDTSQARNVLLKVSARDFAHDYLVPVEDAARANYVSVYWNQLTLQMLHVLAGSPNRFGAAALKKLDQDAFKRFPLRLGAPDFIDSAGIDQIRTDVDQVVFPAASSGAAKVKVEKDSIGDGGRLNEGKDRDKINGDLDLLAGGGLTVADWQKLRKLKTLLDALPQAGGAPLQCTVSITPEPAQKTLLANKQPMLAQFRVIKLVADEKEIGTEIYLANLPPPPADLGPLSVPGSSVKFYIWATQNDFLNRQAPAVCVPRNPNPQRNFLPDPKDPWQCLRFLAGNAQKVKGDPASWDVELQQTVHNVPFSLWVRFKFEKELPDLKDWPQ